MTRMGGRTVPGRLAALIVLCASAAGCMQSTKEFADPPSLAAVPAAPSSAAGAAPGNATPPSTPAAKPAPVAKAAPAAPAAKPVPVAKAAPAAPAPAPAPVAAKATPAVPPDPAPVAATKPAPTGGDEPLPISAPVDAAAAAAVPKTDEDGYPNINAPPDQPVGTLLPPEERKRIIDELNAMRDKQNATKPAKPAAPAASADHGAAALKQIEECSAPDAADNPECQAPAD